MKPKNRIGKAPKPFKFPKFPKGPDIDPAIKFKLDAERDIENQRQKDLEQAALIYVKWKKRFINKPKPGDELIHAVNELAVELDAQITSSFKDYVINEIVNPIIAHLHQSEVLEKFTTKALLSCPHRKLMKKAGDKVAILQPCEWGGIAAFHNLTWSKGAATMDCPQCGGLLTQKDDMILESLTREWYKQKKGKKQ